MCEVLSTLPLNGRPLSSLELRQSSPSSEKFGNLLLETTHAQAVCYSVLLQTVIISHNIFPFGENYAALPWGSIPSYACDAVPRQILKFYLVRLK